eukprot:SAG31_NODE_5071_length_2761_cov_4.024793_3_plen_179_part_00
MNSGTNTAAHAAVHVPRAQAPLPSCSERRWPAPTPPLQHFAFSSAAVASSRGYRAILSRLAFLYSCVSANSESRNGSSPYRLQPAATAARLRSSADGDRRGQQPAQQEQHRSSPRAAKLISALQPLPSSPAVPRDLTAQTILAAWGRGRKVGLRAVNICKSHWERPRLSPKAVNILLK